MQIIQEVDKMAEIKVGDIVIVKDRPDWPSPPGYRMANTEGEVYQVKEETRFVMFRVKRSNIDVLEPGTTMVFPEEALEKI